MRAIDQRGLPDDLARGRSAFQAWRARRPAGGRIPPPLWALAVQLVAKHGVSRTAAALGLDYYSLKRRAKASDQRSASNPAFIELPTPDVAGKQCHFQLDNGAGFTLRVQLVGYDTADLEALACSLRNAL